MIVFLYGRWMRGAVYRWCRAQFWWQEENLRWSLLSKMYQLSAKPDFCIPPSASVLTPAPLWLQTLMMRRFQTMTQSVLREPEHQKKKKTLRYMSRTPSPFMPLLKLSLSFASCSCSKLISPTLSCSLLRNGTWNDQHTFPLGGSDWFMWEQLCISCLGRWKGK